MLNLKEFEVIKREANEHYYRFTIEAKERPMHCTHCYWDELLEDKDRFIVHSSKQREVSDMPIHGKPERRQVDLFGNIIRKKNNFFLLFFYCNTFYKF